MKHFVSSKFWALYQALPQDVRDLADKNYALLKSNPRHPSLHFKRVGPLWSVRVGDHYRALGVDGRWLLLSEQHSGEPESPEEAARNPG